MAAVANIVLADALVTPVNHTFVPLGPDTSGVWWWEDQSAPSAIGYNRISALLVRPGNPTAGTSSDRDRVARVKIKIHTPKLETLSTNDAGLVPPPRVAYVPYFTCEFALPERGILQDRKDIRKYASNLLANVLISDMIENLQNVY